MNKVLSGIFLVLAIVWFTLWLWGLIAGDHDAGAAAMGLACMALYEIYGMKGKEKK